MSTRFTKMHGLGNDFVLVQAGGRPAPAGERIRALADRHTGIGFDQALVLHPARRADTVIYYQGVTALRCGETDNCVLCRGESSWEP